MSIISGTSSSPGVSPSPKNATEALQTLNFLHMLAQLRFFLGACSTYRRFVKDFSKMARPLTDMVQKDVFPDFTNPTTFRCKACGIFKQRSASQPAPAAPKPGQPYTLNCDAAACQLDWALLQEQPDGRLRPGGYWSCSLNDTKEN